MSIFGNIMSAIFKSASPAATTPPSAAPSPGASQASTSTATMDRVDANTTAPGTGKATTASNAPKGSTAAAGPGGVDVAAVLTKLAAQNKEKLDWRTSIVDLMKLLNLDSSLAARKELAHELHYAGDTSDSASMNIWLHKQVMHKLAENGGKVPADLMAR
jgi:Domain of unknown function (DUF3597)